MDLPVRRFNAMGGCDHCGIDHASRQRQIAKYTIESTPASPSSEPPTAPPRRRRFIELSGVSTSDHPYPREPSWGEVAGKSSRALGEFHTEASNRLPEAPPIYTTVAEGVHPLPPSYASTMNVSNMSTLFCFHFILK